MRIAITLNQPAPPFASQWRETLLASLDAPDGPHVLCGGRGCLACCGTGRVEGVKRLARDALQRERTRVDFEGSPTWGFAERLVRLAVTGT